MMRFMGEVLLLVGGFAFVFCRATVYPAHAAPSLFSHPTFYVYFSYCLRVTPAKSLRDASAGGCCSDEHRAAGEGLFACSAKQSGLH